MVAFRKAGDLCQNRAVIIGIVRRDCGIQRKIDCIVIDRESKCREYCLAVEIDGRPCMINRVSTDLGLLVTKL